VTAWKLRDERGRSAAWWRCGAVREIAVWYLLVRRPWMKSKRAMWKETRRKLGRVSSFRKTMSLKTIIFMAG